MDHKKTSNLKKLVLGRETLRHVVGGSAPPKTRTTYAGSIACSGLGVCTNVISDCELCQPDEQP